MRISSFARIAIAVLCVLALSLPDDADAARRKRRKRKRKRQPRQEKVVKPQEPAATEAEAKPAEATKQEPTAEPAPEPAAAEAATPATSGDASAAPVDTIEAAPAGEATDAAPAATTLEATKEGEDEPQAAASEGLGLGVGVKAGATIPTSKLGATYLGAIDLNYRLPWFDRLLGVSFEFSMGTPARSGGGTNEAVGEYTYRLSQWIYILALEAFAAMEFGDFAVYGGVGYGYYFLHAKMRSMGETNTEFQMRSGLLARVGGGYQLGPGDIVLEVRYHWAQLRFRSTGRSDGGGVALGAGYRLKF